MMIPEGPLFCRTLAEVVRALELDYAVIPQTHPDDHRFTGKYPASKGAFYQDDICPIDSPRFDNSYQGLLVVDRPERRRRIHVDLDLYNDGSWSTQLVCEKLGITEKIFNDSVFQYAIDKRSVHFIFNMPFDLDDRYTNEVRGNGNNYYASTVRTKENPLVPPFVELKMGAKTGTPLRIGVKPNKIIRLKGTWPDATQEIYDLIEGAAEIQRDREAEYARERQERQERVLNRDHEATSEAKEKYFDNVRRDNIAPLAYVVKGHRETELNKASFTVGQYVIACEQNIDLVIEEIRSAIEASGLEPREWTYKKVRKSVEDGMKDPKNPFR